MKAGKTNIPDPGLWVERYGDYLYAYVMVRLADEEKAADLVQETFLAALRASKHFKGESSEKTWLTSILKRKIIDVYRQKRKEADLPLNEFGKDYDQGSSAGEDNFIREQAGENEAIRSSSLLPSEELELKELRKIITKCIAKLPENLAAVFVMKMIDGANTEEICKELDISPSNVWVMLHRARARLKKCIVSNWEYNDR